MLNLPVKVLPHHDESLIGFIGRLAIVNGFSHTFLIKKCRDLTDEEVESFCKKSDVPFVWISSVKALSKTRGSLDPLSTYCPKHCPKCLNEGGYWKYVWGLKLYNFCVEHSMQLVDTCHHCGMRLCFAAFTTFRCSLCYRDIRQNRTCLPASTSDVWFSKLLENRALSRPPLNDSALCNLSIGNFHELFINIGFIVSNLAGRNCRNIFLSSDLSKISRSAGKIAFGWPGSFYEYLDFCQNSTGGDKWHPKICYQKIYRVTYHKLKSEGYDFLREEFEHYLLSNWRGPLNPRATTLSPETIQSHRWKPIKAVANSLDLAPSKLKLLLENGLISSSTLRHDCGKISTVVDIQEAKAFVESAARSRSLKDASKQLGINERRVRSLVNGDLLVGYRSSTKALTPWAIDCDNFLSKFLLSDMIDDGGEYLTIRKVLTFYLREDTQFLDFIKALVKGEMVLYAGEQDTSFSDYKLVADDYFFWKSQWLKQHPTTTSLTVREVASVLAVNAEIVYAMINNGLIEHGVIGSQRMIKPSELKRFREKYVLNREVADQFRISPKVVVSCLSENNFKPAAGPHVLNYPCRHYIWRRTDKLYDVLNSIFPYRSVAV